MAKVINPVRGARDLLPCDLRHHKRIVSVFAETAAAYGYRQMATPIFEPSEVFQKTLGADSQVMAKETYTFTDSGGRSLTLRPEGTAAIVRAFTNLNEPSLPIRVFYEGAMFRRERPQRGRLRQFHQAGVELLGEASVHADAEVITLAARCLAKLGLKVAPLLRLNTIGDAASRREWARELDKYFAAHRGELSAESRSRIGRNPLRILDSKEENDRRIAAEAPKFTEFISAAAERFFKDLTKLLEQAGIKWTHDERLVRGLDYYCHTAFEFSVRGLGRQGTVLAGGRYDGLAAVLGGQDVAGIGWAAGIERLAELTSIPDLEPVAMLIAIGDEAAAKSLILAERLRKSGYAIELIVSSLAKGLKLANRRRARVVLFLGEDEIAQGRLGVRNMENGEQRFFGWDDSPQNNPSWDNPSWSNLSWNNLSWNNLERIEWLKPRD